MISTTIKQFAGEMNLTSDRLIEQLNAAGVLKNSPNDFLTAADKAKLLEYLKKSHGSPMKMGSITNNKTNLSDLRENKKSLEQNRKKILNESKIHLFEQDQPINQKITDVSIENISPDIDNLSGKKIKWSKLESISISNFKAIDKLTVPLKEVTILVGPNGSGKSSILQAIHWAARAASYISPGNQNEVVTFDRLDYSPSSEPLKSAHKTELTTERTSEPTMVSFNHEPSADGSSSAAIIKIWAARYSAGVTVNIEGGTAVSPFKQREELITAYIPGLAGLAEKETLLVQPLLRRHAASGEAGSVLRNILFNIASRQLGEQDNTAATERVSQLNELVQSIHPGVSLEVSFNDRDDINIQATFDDNTLSGIKRPLETAATGVLQVIQIFSYLILFRPKLLLVDEPDAHLHPDKQERLIEALEQAASQYKTQIIITTHSPHITRAASPAANLLWVNNGKISEQQEGAIRTLLGWGGLDKKIIFFVEDENDHAIRAILRQWPHLYRQISISRCFGVDNLPGNSLLKGLLTSDSFNVKIVIHRDRDFMTEKECHTWANRYNQDEISVWITDYSDAEAYFCQKDYLSSLYSVPIATAEEWINSAASKLTGTQKAFLDKRKVFIRLLYEHGGSPNSYELWDEGSGSPLETTLGKTLHKALKIEVKAAGHDDKLLDRFTIPEGYIVAPKLHQILNDLLSAEGDTTSS
ncbi:recombinase RecF [Chromobacterium violaceum]|uniref:Recombinase RecF n=2 Tax=Chromobacterium violaceum TaxID=536 RepID=A0A202BGZ7_CHRVL|nr:recombinase RecF [Chromobacterium violaceum]